MPAVRPVGGRVPVQVRLRDPSPATVEALRGAGLEVDGFSPDHGLAYGRIDLDHLDELAGLAEVTTLHPMPRPGLRSAGSVADQADLTLRAATARSDLGVDGSGVTVGVLSDSLRDQSAGTVSGSGCDRSILATTSQLSGDLPGGVGGLISLDDGPGGGTDSGRAMAELTFDLAPGAEFVFHSANNSPADFAAGIGELVACGADVIVDDFFWPLQPFFQDGEIAQAARAAVAAGVHTFSAAGDDAGFGIDDLFADSAATDDEVSPPSGNDLHDFDPGAPSDPFAAITVPAGCDLYTELQWSEPFSGNLGAGAASDLDLFLLDSASPPTSIDPGVGNVLDAGVTPQGCGDAGPPSGDPLEFVLYENTSGSPATVYLAIDHYCGDESVELRIVTISFDCDVTADFLDADPTTGYDFEDGIDFVDGLPEIDAAETAIFTDSQIFGHPAATGVIAVAAAFYGEIDGNGTVDPPTAPGVLDVEAFSSLGGDLPFFFDGSGAPLPGAPALRFKPEITAADGTNNTFLGTDSDGDSAPNFFGTSAAAAHAAAVAALMEELGNLTPAGLIQVLEQSASDLESPGRDALSGSGLIDALRAVGTTTPAAPQCYLDELVLTGKPNQPAAAGTLNQTFRACNNLTVGEGDFTGVEGIAATVILGNGFQSGDASVWGH